MAQELASLAIAIRTNDLKKATTELNKLEKAGRKTEKATDSLTKSAVKLGAAYLSFTAVASVTKAFIAQADTMTRLDSQIKLVTNSTQELEETQADLFALSQETRQSLEATTNLYARMARASESMGTSQEDLLVATKAVNQALVISGASATEASSTITQLSQALASGVLRGEEFNSISENGSRVARALADNLGVTVGELRAMAKEGKLTSDVVMQALIEQAETLEGEFGQMGTTVEQSMTVTNNSMLSLVGTINDVTGATDSLSSMLIGFSSILDDLNVKIKDYADNVVNVHDVHKLTSIADATRELDQLKEAYRLNIFEGVGLLQSTTNYNAEIKNQEFLITSLIRKIERLNEVGGVDASALETGGGNPIFSIDESDFEEGIDFAMAQNEELFKQKTELQKRADKQWLESEKKQTKASEKMWDNIGDIAKNNITGALQAGMDGTLDLTAFTSQISKSIGQAMLMQGNILAGLGLMGVGSLLGGGDTKSATEQADDRFNKFMEGLDKASKALEEFGNVGSSTSNQIESLQSQILTTTSRTEALRGRRAGVGGGVIGQAYDEMIKSSTLETKKLRIQLSSVISGSLGEALDISKLTTSQIQELTTGIDVKAMQALEIELNNIALASKKGTATAKDNARATEILTNTEFARYKDYAEAIDLVSKSTEDATQVMLDSQRAVNNAMLGNLSYLSDIEKLAFANNIYQNAITQEDRIASSRNIAEISRGTTRTREDYVPIFAQYINELKKQDEEATLTDVVNELVTVGEKIDEQTDSASDGLIYA